MSLYLHLEHPQGGVLGVSASQMGSPDWDSIPGRLGDTQIRGSTPDLLNQKFCPLGDSEAHLGLRTNGVSYLSSYRLSLLTVLERSSVHFAFRELGIVPVNTVIC